MAKKVAKKVKKKTSKKRTTKPSSQSGENKPERTAAGTFAKGQSGNPNGRPKGVGIVGHLLRLGLDVPEPNGTKQRNLQLAELIWKMALEGDKYCMGVLIDRIDGPVVTVVESEGGLLGTDLLGKRLVIEQTIMEPAKE